MRRTQSNHLTVIVTFVMSVMFAMPTVANSQASQDTSQETQLQKQTNQTIIQTNNVKSQKSLKKAKRRARKYAKGRFIVKFKEGQEESYSQSSNNKKRKRKLKVARKNKKKESINRLKNKYRVKRQKRLFERMENMTEEEKIAFKKKLKERRAKRKERRQQRRQQRKASQLDTQNHQEQTAETEVNFEEFEKIYVLEIDEGQDVEEVVAAFNQDSNVAYAQPDYEVEAYYTPNDTYLYQLWGMQKIQAEQAWDYSQGEGVVVAVVDTGVDYNHNDLADNMWQNPNEIPGNNYDDDGNGFIDDVSGWDFANNDNDPLDGHGHGTHVAATIAGVGNNGYGVVGVAPRAKIMPLKGLRDDGNGSISALASSVEYAAINGADIINNSWGCKTACPYNPVAEEAVRLAHELGALIVFSAGNNNEDVNNYSPQKMEETIAVAAYDNADSKAYFSNYGAQIDVAAPGVSILSAYPNNRFALMSGTSMAAPHVAGLLAQMLPQFPQATPEWFRQTIRNTSHDIAPAGFDIYSGYGRINAYRALSAEPPDESLKVVAKIDSPKMNQAIFVRDESLEVVGTAAGANFDHYQLSYKEKASESEWQDFEDAVYGSVEEDVLGAFDITSFNMGEYLIRLQVFQSDGQSSEVIRELFFDTNEYGIRTIEVEAESVPFTGVDNNTIVWVQDEGESQSLYLYNIDTNVTFSVETANEIGKPSVSGNRIAWANSEEGLVIYDYTNNEKTIVSNTQEGYVGNVSLKGNQCVYEYRPTADGKAQIFLFDLETQENRQITSGESNKFSPVLNDSYAVWVDDSYNASSPDVFLYNFETQNQTRLTYYTYQKSLDISDKYVVWEDKRREEGQSGVYLYDLETQQTKRAMSVESLSMKFKLQSDQLFYEDRNSDPRRLMKVDIESGEREEFITMLERYIGPDFNGSDGVLMWRDIRKVGLTHINYIDYRNQDEDEPVAPTFEYIVDKNVTEGNSLEFAVRTDDSSAMLSARLHNGQGLDTIGASFTDNNDGTGTFSWEAKKITLGESFSVIFTAENEEGAKSECAAFIKVRANLPPTIAPIKNQRLVAQEKYTLEVMASDPDGDQISLRAEISRSSDPLSTVGASFEDRGDGTGLFEFTPTTDRSKEIVRIKFFAEDSFGNTSYDLVTYMMYIPAFITLPHEGQVLEQTSQVFEWNQPNAQQYTLNIKNSERELFNQTMSYITSVNVEGLPLNGQEITATMTTHFYDGDKSYEYKFQMAQDQPPVINTIGSRSNFDAPFFLQAGSTEEYVVDASDPEGGQLEYSLSNQPEFVTLSIKEDGKTYVVAQSEASDGGLHEGIILTVKDEMENEVTQNFDVLVNRAPSITGPTSIQGKSNEEIKFTVYATDADQHAITFEEDADKPMPNGAVFTQYEHTITFKWAPSDQQVGTHNVGFIARDQYGATAKHAITIEVEQAANEVAEMITPEEGSTLGKTATFTWEEASGARMYYLFVGTSKGRNDVFSRSTTGTSFDVTGIPQRGSPIYVRLWTYTSKGWKNNDYSYTTDKLEEEYKEAEITKPLNGSTIKTTTVAFEWTAATDASYYYLYVGSRKGYGNISRQFLSSGSSVTVKNIPLNGQPVYARLYSRVGYRWVVKDYVYQTINNMPVPKLAELISPANGSKLESSAATFTWTKGEGVASTYFYMGSVRGSRDIRGDYTRQNTSLTVNNVPLTGRTVYVRLWSKTNQGWKYNDYSFQTIKSQEGNKNAEMVSPSPGATLSGSTVTFNWSQGEGVSQYYIYVGSRLGGLEIAYKNMSQNQSVTFSNIPTNGQKIYIRLWSRIYNKWKYNDYEYVAK